MNSSLKAGLLVGLVMLVIFGATVISQYTADQKSLNPDDAADTPTQPLRLAGTDRRYDPFSAEPAERNFQAHHEQGQRAMAAFWFHNVNPTPVRVAVRGVSCGSCSYFAVGTFPTPAVNEFAVRSAAGLFPASPLPVPDLMTAVGYAALLQKQTFVELDVKEKNGTAEIPAAGPDGPAVGYFLLGVNVGSEGPIAPRSIDVGLQTGKMPSPATVHLAVHLVGAKPFEVTPATLKLGTFPEGAPDRNFEFAYWSATRSQAALPPPKLAVFGDGSFVTVGTPVPLTPAERQLLADSLLRADPNKRPVPVAGGYNVPVRVRRKVDGATPPEPDIGPFERVIGVSGDAPKAERVTIRGTVTGLVALGDGLSEAKLGDFNAEFGVSKEFKLHADRADVELETVPAECVPKYLEATLSAPVTEGTRRTWTLKIAVPAQAGIGYLPPDAVVVVRSKGANPQRVRIPVQGNGFRR